MKDWIGNLDHIRDLPVDDVGLLLSPPNVSLDRTQNGNAIFMHESYKIILRY